MLVILHNTEFSYFIQIVLIVICSNFIEIKCNLLVDSESILRVQPTNDFLIENKSYNNYNNYNKNKFQPYPNDVSFNNKLQFTRNYIDNGDNQYPSVNLNKHENVESDKSGSDNIGDSNNLNIKDINPLTQIPKPPINWKSRLQFIHLLSKIKNYYNSSQYNIDHLNSTGLPSSTEATKLLIPATIKPNPSLFDGYEDITANDDDDEYFDFDAIHDNLNLPNRPCLLSPSDQYFLWWLNQNGTLVEYDSIYNISAIDLSHTELTMLVLIQKMSELRKLDARIEFLSLAYNLLDTIPYEALYMIKESIKYLSVTGNSFVTVRQQNSTNNRQINVWARFPYLFNLTELDIRNCRISNIDQTTFANLPNLKKLYLSYNHIIQLSANTFEWMSGLTHLDLSHNNDFENINELQRQVFLKSATGTQWINDPYVSRIFDGLDIHRDAFEHLCNLQYLDLSHTKITISSSQSLAKISNTIKLLSFCHSQLNFVPKGAFDRPNLRILDISGNPNIFAKSEQNYYPNNSNLELLSAECSNIRDLSWANSLTGLKILHLASNNINMITNETFAHMKSLAMIDLSFNYIGNWYDQVFTGNDHLKVLNLRSNKINFLTSEMLRDFGRLRYLAIGRNKFVCNCILRELIDLTTHDNHVINITVGENIPPNIYDHILNKTGLNNDRQCSNTSTNDECIYRDKRNRIRQSLIDRYFKSEEEDIEIDDNLLNYRIRSRRIDAVNRFLCFPSTDNCEMTFREVDFSFTLIDFIDIDYTCMNSTTNFECFLADIAKCIAERNWDLSMFRRRSYTTSIILGVILLLLISMLLLYKKWWYFRYFCIIVRNATILSFLDKDYKEMMTKNVNFTYDVFVSYCDENREWILEELLPNIEHRDINVCLHERDFEVGIGILENIISCMDRSRILLLVVSPSFLLSQWCQFEMHLAQHRLLETNRDELILILLEDIPRRKRPKTLHYLMRTKTYIKWPTEDKETKKTKKELVEERRLFWRRLRRALIETEWESSEQMKNTSPA